MWTSINVSLSCDLHLAFLLFCFPPSLAWAVLGGGDRDGVAECEPVSVRGAAPAPGLPGGKRSGRAGRRPGERAAGRGAVRSHAKLSCTIQGRVKGPKTVTPTIGYNVSV